VARLRDRDEQAFAAVVDAYTPAMLRVARNYVATQELAEDVVQETWIGVVKGIGNFEGRCSLRSWIFTVLINTAKTRGQRERRDEQNRREIYGGRTVDPARFSPAG
ncbi:MAG: sigma-70 family RNA polymerase sigma factor, partial [Mycobacterium sp.]|nr:sigma-70 family RNA polymerase sigma factor [Mycobacterium sp.]